MSVCSGCVCVCACGCGCVCVACICVCKVTMPHSLKKKKKWTELYNDLCNYLYIQNVISFFSLSFTSLDGDTGCLDETCCLCRAVSSPWSCSLRSLSCWHHAVGGVGGSVCWTLAQCVARTHVCLANVHLLEHVGVHSVVACSEPEQNDLVRSVQLVVAV